MLHSAINPFLYSIYSKRFRNGVQEYIKIRSKKTDQYLIEDSLDQFIRSFNKGQQQGKESKRVVNKLALKRHFNHESGENNRNDILLSDMVVIHQSQCHGITRFKKFGTSLHSKPVTRSVALSTTIPIARSMDWMRFEERLSHRAKKTNKEMSKSCSLKSEKARLYSQNLNCKRNYKSEGV